MSPPPFLFFPRRSKGRFPKNGPDLESTMLTFALAEKAANEKRAAERWAEIEADEQVHRAERQRQRAAARLEEANTRVRQAQDAEMQRDMHEQRRAARLQRANTLAIQAQDAETSTKKNTECRTCQRWEAAVAAMSSSANKRGPEKAEMKKSKTW